MIPVTQEDVEKALERELTDDESATVLEGRAEKASDLVEGYIGFAYDPTDAANPIPGVVTRVVARMVARSLMASAVNADTTFTDSVTQNIGPFGATQRFNPNASSGDGPWLSKADKTALRPVYSGTRSIGMQSDRCSSTRLG